MATRPSWVLVSGALIPARRIGVLCMTTLNPRSMSSRMVSPSVTDMTVALYSYIIELRARLFCALAIGLWQILVYEFRLRLPL